MADAGVQVVEQLLPAVVQEHKPDVVVAQAENVTGGRGMSVDDMRKLQSLGIDFFTGGNWTPYLEELHPLLKDSKEPVIGPANYEAEPGLGYKYLDTPSGKVLFVSLMGQVVGKKLPNIENPLHVIDRILEEEHTKQTPVATVVNFHGALVVKKGL